MAKIIFITGGAASGKTRWAVSYYEGCDNVLYLCVSPKMDPDILERLNFSNNKHGVEWDIHTDTRDLKSYVKEHKFVILDNLGAYVSSSMKELCPDISQMNNDLKHQIEKSIIDDVIGVMDAVKEIDGNLLIVTIETGFSVCPQNDDQVYFREILGTVNQRIANMCTDVYMSASGIQFKIK